MDSHFHDLYIKFKNNNLEIVFNRGITHKHLYDIIETINQLNRCHEALNGKPLIESIRIE